MTRAFSLLSVLVCAAAVVAAETQGNQPYPDLPSVLLYDGCEGAPPPFKHGTVSDGKSVTPGRMSYKLGKAEWGKDDHFLWMQVDLPRAGARIPGPHAPETIFVSFAIQAEDLGLITLKFKHPDGDYEIRQNYTRAGVWQAVSVPMSDLRNRNLKPETGQICHVLEIQFRPRSPKYPQAFVDQILVTQGVGPAAVLPRVMEAEKQAAAINRQVARDGFEFNSAMRTRLQDVLKKAPARKSARRVVLAGAPKTEIEALARGATTQALEAVSHSPENPADVLATLRATLPAALAEQQAAAVAVVVSARDAIAPSAVRNLTVILDRSLDSGVVPFVVLPPVTAALDGGAREAVETFRRLAVAQCAERGVAWIDPQSSATAGAALQAALQHVGKHLRNRW